MYQRWLSAFHAVARSGGFTAASKVLNIGQPTVSTHVSALEDHFGVELFHRRGRRVELTAIGRELLTITEGLFGREGEAIELLRAVQARETGSLRIGAVRPLDAMEICARLLNQYPNLRPGGQTGLRRLMSSAACSASISTPVSSATRPTIPGCFRRSTNAIASISSPMSIIRWRGGAPSESTNSRSNALFNAPAVRSIAR